MVCHAAIVLAWVLFFVFITHHAPAAVLGEYTIEPASTGQLTRLPDLGGRPQVSDLAGTPTVQHSVSNFTAFYNFSPTQVYNGVFVHWPDFAERDLSAVTTFVFAATGAAQQVKVEFEDAASDRTIFFLTGVTDTLQYYHIPASLVSNLAAIKAIPVVTDEPLAGNTNGAFTFFMDGLEFAFLFGGDAAGPASVLPGGPRAFATGGANPGTWVVNTNAGLVELGYNVTSGYAGATIAFDDFGTPGVETADLTPLAPLVFGLYGNPAAAKIEFLDENGFVTIATCTGLASSVQYFAIEPGVLTNDASRIVAMHVIVDAGLHGEGVQTGRLFVATGGLNYNIECVGAVTGTPTVLPGLPGVIPLGGANASTKVRQRSTTDFSVVYNVATGFAGATILFDDFGTATNEYQDLSGFGELVFAVTGSTEKLAVEVIDIFTNRATATLLDTQTDTFRFYTINSSDLTAKGVDVSRVRFINFVVDAALAGAFDLAGRFGVRTAGLRVPDLIYDAEATNVVTTLPPLPNVILLGGANPDTEVDPLSAQRFRVTYDVGGGGFAGGTILYDDYGTGPIEVGDFSSLTQVVFRVRGQPARVKIEFEDDVGAKVPATLDDVTTDGPYYTIPLADLAVRGLDLARVRFINLVVDAALAAPGALTGFVDLETDGLSFDNLIYPRRDLDADDLDDAWEELHGLDPLSGAGDDGPDGDPDGDGASNREEQMAGTDPRDPDSLAALDVARTNGGVRVSLPGVDHRTYRFERTRELAAGAWTSVVATVARLEAGRVEAFDAEVADDAFYRCRIEVADASPMPDRPRIILVGGGNGDTLIAQTSTRDFTVNYDVTTGGWSGATILFDNFGTLPIESADLSGYAAVLFVISGTPSTIKYEFEDADGVRVLGTFRRVGPTPEVYRVPAAMLAAGGLDLTRVRFINFVVDQSAAGPGNFAGLFTVRSFGLHYDAKPEGFASGSATVLPGAPVVDDLGGANSAGNWTASDTNVLVAYDLTGGGWEGITIRWDDYETPELESADLSGFTSLVFGVQGAPQAVKMEFVDTATNQALAILEGVTNAYRYYSVPTADLADIGIDLTQVRLINVVVDQGLAGPGNHTGTFSVATGGLGP